MNRQDSPQAIAAVDDILASVGLGHGRRKTLAGSWQNGERRPRTRHVVASTAQADSPASSARWPESVHVAEWHRYAWLHHGFSTRHGGVSSVYDCVGGDCIAAGSLNLAWSEQDDPANVRENRRRFLAEMLGNRASGTVRLSTGSESYDARLLTVRQIHSGLIRIIEVEDVTDPARLHTADGRAKLRGDGLMTDVRGFVLGILTADCVPVLVADTRRRAVAAFHAGWRGTLGRIVERGIGAMRLRYGSQPEDLIAAIGPAIGPCCYAVSEELRFDFDSQFSYAAKLFSEVSDSDPIHEKYPLLFLTARAPGHSNIGPQIHLDLWEANRRQLLDAGVPARRITVVGECTACTGVASSAGRKYFSHRAESGFTGRMLAAIGLTPQ
jgi:YfiH family protein